MTKKQVEKAYAQFVVQVQIAQDKCKKDGKIKKNIADIGTPEEPKVLNKKDFEVGKYYLVNYTLNPLQHPQYHLLRIDETVVGKGKGTPTQYVCADITGYGHGVTTAVNTKTLIPLKKPKFGEKSVPSDSKSLVAKLNIPEPNFGMGTKETTHEIGLRDATILLQELKDMTSGPPGELDQALRVMPVIPDEQQRLRAVVEKMSDSAQEPSLARALPPDPEMKKFLQSIDSTGAKSLLYHSYYVPMLQKGYTMKKLISDDPVGIMREMADVLVVPEADKTKLLQGLYMLKDKSWNYGKIGAWLDLHELGDYKAAMNLAGYTEVDELLYTEYVDPAEVAVDIVGEANDPDRKKLQALVERLQYQGGEPPPHVPEPEPYPGEDGTYGIEEWLSTWDINEKRRKVVFEVLTKAPFSLDTFNKCQDMTAGTFEAIMAALAKYGWGDRVNEHIRWQLNQYLMGGSNRRRSNKRRRNQRRSNKRRSNKRRTRTRRIRRSNKRRSNKRRTRRIRRRTRQINRSNRRRRSRKLRS